MKGRRFVNLGAAALALTIAAGGGAMLLSQGVAAQGRGGQAPRLDVDPLWPKPFPVEKHWALGSVTGVAVDAQDHIWVSNRGVNSLQNNEKGPTLQPWASECCFGAPEVLEFDAAGTLLTSWGGPGQGYQWPQNPAGITVDGKGNVWIAAGGFAPPPAGRGRGPAPAAAPAAGGAAAGAARGAGRGAPAAGGAAAPAAAAAPAGRGAPAAPAGPADAHVLKFDKTGKFLLQIGTPGKMDGPESKDTLNRPQAVAVDDAANEVYVADSGNKRIVVFDANTGAFKRQWTGYGTAFGRLSCVALSKDGQVYVCDRKNDRIQVFKKDGTFVKEGFVSKATTMHGSVWDIAFSSDAAQRYLFVADGQDEKVFTLDRTSLETLSSFGDGGGLPGAFRLVGSVGMDSKGNLYTGETFEGKRVQKFVKK